MEINILEQFRSIKTGGGDLIGICLRYSKTQKLWLCGFGPNSRPKYRGVGDTPEEAVADFIRKSKDTPQERYGKD